MSNDNDNDRRRELLLRRDARSLGLSVMGSPEEIDKRIHDYKIAHREKALARVSKLSKKRESKKQKQKERTKQKLRKRTINTEGRNRGSNSSNSSTGSHNPLPARRHSRHHFGLKRRTTKKGKVIMIQKLKLSKT